MIKEVIRLVKPGLFLPMFAIEKPAEDAVLVRPRYLSICAADQRYFQGNRPPKVLEKKLPISLFHEAVGEIVVDPLHQFPEGSFCILLPGGVDAQVKASNYAIGAFFRSSNRDGFCQEVLAMDRSELIPITKTPVWPYVFTELMSVCVQAYGRLTEIRKVTEKTSFGVLGDGSMGYMMAQTLRIIFPKAQISVFGKHDEKLLNFSFCTHRVNIQDTSHVAEIDVFFECVGGNAAQNAIQMAVQKINPTGTIILMGVSEVPPVVPTRLILEKGLTLIGSSRSVRADFEMAKSFIDRDEIKNSLQKIVSAHTSFQTASELGDIFTRDKNLPYKTILYKNF
ncbi:MAG: hypothetical protein J5846_09100 [Desulfovibrio sp.]|nr:hypothetical protein [Desulfovibrio sp.]